MLSLRRKRSEESVPVGTLLPFAGMTAPDGFFLADGSVRSRTQFQDLFRALCSINSGINLTSGAASITGFSDTSTFAVGMPISGNGIPSGATISIISGPTSLIMSVNATLTGTSEVVVAPWGVGDGSTTFNIPDGRGIVFAGRDNMGGTAASRLTSAVAGARIGAVGGAQTHSLTAAENGAHTHGCVTGDNASNAGTFFGTFTTNDGGSLTTQNSGSGAAHNNTQPTAICNYIVRY